MGICITSQTGVYVRTAVRLLIIRGGMMGVYIKGMKMQNNCRECPFESYLSDIGRTVCVAKLKWVAAGFETIQFEGRAGCPLAEMPEDQIKYVLRSMETVFEPGERTIGNSASEIEQIFDKVHE